MQNLDSISHVRGESSYLDDIPLVEETLFACVFDSPLAHGRIRSLETGAASSAEGVVAVLTAEDIPGENQIGGIIPDEPLLAEGEVHFAGMPIAIVLAESDLQARRAARKIKIEIEALPAITDPREAFGLGKLIGEPKRFRLGETASAFDACAHTFEGRADVNGQEHLYIETQGAYVIPMEGRGLKVYSSTQGPTVVQRCVSRVTGLPMHRVEVDVTRLGGGFGGKEDQANAWAAVCAVGSMITGRPVKISLHRMDDMRMTGKRHPYSADYRIGLGEDLRIDAYEVTFYQNSGAAADLSLPVLERTLFHCTNAYFIPNVSAVAYACRTNLPPNTAFRGFGGPQGMFVVESAIAHAAGELGVHASEIQERNLIKDGEEFPYGQKAKSEAPKSWENAATSFGLAGLRKEAARFNSKEKFRKRGIAVQPVCFGISFTKTPMNQARSLVHVYTDGSVAVSTGAVEMGQGVNTKIAQVAARIFSLPVAKVKVHTANTLRIANTSPTAASAAADLNGKATQLACERILARMKTIAGELLEARDEHEISIADEAVFRGGERSDLDWVTLVNEVYLRRVSLSEHAHYATPGISFDWSIAKGNPFAYHVYGTAVLGVTVDCLRGTHKVDFVKVVHDFGRSMNPAVDVGQIEGGIVQGIGWLTNEELAYSDDGVLLSNSLSTYKIPDIYAIPEVIEVLALETDRENLAIFDSKAVGEPPLMYGIGAYFAIRDAVRAFNPDHETGFDAPFTPEKTLIGLYRRKSED